MTLLEILREHLKEWPEGVRAFGQNGKGRVMANMEGETVAARAPNQEAYLLLRDIDEMWWDMVDPQTLADYLYLPLADDASTAIVTREMWEGVLPSAHD